MIFHSSAADAGMRLDQFLARHMPETSRARLQEWIKSGQVQLNGAPAKPSSRLRNDDRVELLGKPAVPAPPKAFPEDIPLEILYEDDDIVAVNKPAGMPMHAGAGRTSGTLVNALLHRFGRLSRLSGELRPGIVHRLDRLTSGVLLVAKTDAAHASLARQFAARQVRKTYVALVHGSIPPGRGRHVEHDGARWTRLEMPVRRDRVRRIRMTARGREGRPAVTDFRVLEELPGFSLLEVRIATGRTHQIRVHLSAIGHPVVGDTLYGAPAQADFPRVFLHAREIGFLHPSTGEAVVISAPLPPELLTWLGRHRRGG